MPPRALAAMRDIGWVAVLCRLAGGPWPNALVLMSISPLATLFLIVVATILAATTAATLEKPK